MRDRIPGRLGGIEDAYAYIIPREQFWPAICFLFSIGKSINSNKRNKYTLH